MRLIDADALVRGVVNSEIRMHTRHEVFTSLIYEQPVVEAIPVAWLENLRDGLDALGESRLIRAIDVIIDAYRAEVKRETD